MLDNIFRDILIYIGAFVRYIFLKIIGKNVTYKKIRDNDEETGCLNFFIGLGFLLGLIGLIPILFEWLY